MGRAKYLLALAIVLIGLWTCERLNTPYSTTEVELAIQGTGVTEAWLRLKVSELKADSEVEVAREDTVIFRCGDFNGDTLIYDSGLAPAQEYRYRVYVTGSGKHVEAYSVRLTTMDTTSHDFQWEVVEFPSPFGSGALYDVAIINENDIWAVGEIYADSAQPWLPYNAVHWDGRKWELRRIYFYLCPNGNSPTPFPIQAIYAFATDDIWFTRGGSIVHWDGSNFIHDCSINSVINGSIYKLWGTDSNNLYAVGANGTIAHYDGVSWRLLESGTELPIQDIWGGIDPQTGEEMVICVASRYLYNQGKKLLQIQGNRVKELPAEGLPWSLKSIWFIPGLVYYVAGDGLFFSRDLTETWKQLPSPLLYKHAIRGQALNDVIVVGYKLLSHFNGVNWHHYTDDQLPAALYNAVAIKGNLVVAMGLQGGRVIITIGRR